MKKKKKFDLSLDNSPKEEMKYYLEILKRKSLAEAEDIFGGEKLISSRQKESEIEPNFFETPSVFLAKESKTMKEILVDARAKSLKIAQGIFGK